MKTTLNTINYNEFEDWRSKLDDADVCYEWHSEPAGDAILYILKVDAEIAVEVLHFKVQDIAQTTKATKEAHPFVQFIVGLGLLLGFVLFIGYCFFGGASNEKPVIISTSTPLKMDYLSIIGKSKADIIARFGEPVYFYKMTGRANSERLIWTDAKGNEFEIRFDGDTAFAFTWNDYEVNANYNVLMAIGMPQQSPDYSNGNLKRWDNINNFKVLATKFDEYVMVYCEALN